jgi:hypothetical protein
MPSAELVHDIRIASSNIGYDELRPVQPLSNFLGNRFDDRVQGDPPNAITEFIESGFKYRAKQPVGAASNVRFRVIKRTDHESDLRFARHSPLLFHSVADGAGQSLVETDHSINDAASMI